MCTYKLGYIKIQISFIKRQPKRIGKIKPQTEKRYLQQKSWVIISKEFLQINDKKQTIQWRNRQKLLTGIPLKKKMSYKYTIIDLINNQEKH